MLQLACYPELAIDFDNLSEKARSQGWTIIGEENLNKGDPYDPHCKFLCDHDWSDVAALARTVTDCHYIEHTVLPINIYSGEKRFRDRRSAAEYYDEMIPRMQLVNGADVVWEQPLDATVPPVSGRELKERALEWGFTSLTFLSGTPLEDKDSIVAPAIDLGDLDEDEDPECPGHIVFSCERAKKRRLRGKQNAMNLYKPY